jgi:peroxiredoxin
MRKFKGWLKIVLILITLIFGVVLIYLIAARFFNEPPKEITFEPEEAKQSAEGKKINYLAPDFKLLNIEGEKVKLSDYKDKNIVLTFWTSWNPAAQDQIVILESYYQEIKDKKDIVLLTVNNQEDKSVVSNFIRRGGYILPILLDEDGSVGELYKISTLPATYFINQKRMVKEIYIGVLSREELKDKVEGLYRQ